MATQLETVNRILRRLRESTQTTIMSTDYSMLIAEFVNDAIETIEEAWLWQVYATTKSVSILGDESTVDYTLTNISDRAFLARSIQNGDPLAFDTTSGEELQLKLISASDRRKRNNLDTATVQFPTEFSISDNSDGYLHLYIPQASQNARTWSLYFYSPQATLALDGTDDSTEIQLPARPVYLLALYYALNERGEEMGEPGNVAETKANNALAAAIEADMQADLWPERLNMTNLEAMRNDILEGV